ncbi:MAG: hypothetical protein JO025_26980 [Verrucomicrobia bacterium]|nr:hypothetical protein [Verrucomicrobiota bacterium]
MAIDLTVPDSNMQAPEQPVPKVVAPNSQVQQLANTKAVSILKQKARKACEMTIRVGGLLLNFESATVGQLLGFSPNVERWTGDGEQKNWALSEVQFTIKGGNHGSKTELKFVQCVPNIKAQGNG